MAVNPALLSATARMLRTGESLFLLCPDVRPYQTGAVAALPVSSKQRELLASYPLPQKVL